MGWTFPWAVVAVRGTNVCLRKIDYPLIWKLLKEQGITHFNAAPTVNTLLCAAPEAERLPHPVRVTVAASPPSGYLFEQMVCSPSAFCPSCNASSRAGCHHYPRPASTSTRSTSTA